MNATMNATTCLRAELTDVAFGAFLRRVVGRRVPAADVEDIVQATLCDALASRRVPETSVEVRRWLVRIATNKAVDHFRGRRRDDASAHGAVDVDELPAAPLDAESRIFVARALELLEGDASMRQTLDLALREADGESYAQLAHAEGSSPAALRQRVSRFRRLMTSRWLVAAALALVVGFAASRLQEEAARTIGGDVAPVSAGNVAGEANVHVTQAMQAMSGRWRVTSWVGTGERAPRVLPPDLRVEVDAASATIRISSLAAAHVSSVLGVASRGDESGASDWRIGTPSVTARVQMSATGRTGNVVVTDGPWAGTASIERD